MLKSTKKIIETVERLDLRISEHKKDFNLERLSNNAFQEEVRKEFAGVNNGIKLILERLESHAIKPKRGSRKQKSSWIEHKSIIDALGALPVNGGSEVMKFQWAGKNASRSIRNALYHFFPNMKFSIKTRYGKFLIRRKA